METLKKTIQHLARPVGAGAILFMLACSTYVTQPEFDRVRQGMTRDQVQETIGGKSPQVRRVEPGGRETWLLDVAIPYTHNFVGKQIIFEKGRVAALGPSPERQKLIDENRRRRAAARRNAAIAEQKRIERQQLIALEADRLATRRAEARAIESQKRPAVVYIRPGQAPAADPTRPVQHYRFDFYGLLQRVRGKDFSSDKLELIQDAARSAHFSCSQVVTLLKEFSHSSDQMKLLRIVSGRISDPRNRYTIVESFTFSSDKKKARSILGL